MSLEQSILSQLLGFSNRVASAESAAKSLQQSNNQFLKGLTDTNDKLTAQGSRLTDSIDALSEIVLLISNTNPENLNISDLEARVAALEDGGSTPTPDNTARVGQTFFNSTLPALQAYDHNNSGELGLYFTVDVPGKVYALRYFKSPGEGGTHFGRLWSGDGQKLLEQQFLLETAWGWQTQTLPSPFQLQANTVYCVTANFNRYVPTSPNQVSSYLVSGNLRAATDRPNGAWGDIGTLPTSGYQDSNYFRDVVFVAD